MANHEITQPKSEADACGFDFGCREVGACAMRSVIRSYSSLVQDTELRSQLSPDQDPESTKKRLVDLERMSKSFDQCGIIKAATQDEEQLHAC